MCPPNPSSRHCTIPAPEAGYSASTEVTPATVGQEITYMCSGQYATVTGSGSNELKITCGSDTNFPSGWPKCKVGKIANLVTNCKIIIGNKSANMVTIGNISARWSAR